MKGLWWLLITHGGDEKCIQNLVEISEEKGPSGAFRNVKQNKKSAMFHKESVGRELE
jgi:hypothetical protein